MPYSGELELLRATFKKSNVNVLCLKKADFYALRETNPLDTGTNFEDDKTPYLFTQKLAPYTLYKQVDTYRRAWIYFLLPGGEQKVFLFGPYLTTQLLDYELLEMAEEMGLPPQMQSTLHEYYAAMPVLKNASSLFVMLETFCERVFKRPSFAVVDLESEPRTPVSWLTAAPNAATFDDHLAKMKVLEKRYEFENTMIRSVMLGRQLTDRGLLPDFSTLHFEARSSSPIRSAKNYCIILNTLLRKAAEAGGVHPVYLDRISSDFAKKIEDLSVLSVCPMLMNEMLSSYCRLVQKHSIKNYSRPVQKAIMLIDYDLSAPLTLSTIATAQGLSEGYLAKIFKKETGKTVCEYVRDKRMKHASHLLATTKLQIQTIALHCGILDLQYFSKLFKRHTGKTPKEYRLSRH